MIERDERMKTKVYYILTFLVLLIIEIVIALFVDDRFIRPFVGDILIVILMYTFIRGVHQKLIKFLPIYLLLFAIAVEVIRYFHLIEIFNLQDNALISIIVGNTFDTKDILCYLLGTTILLTWEKIEKRYIDMII